MRIRGHHLPCILGFRGLDYDKRFVQNMEKIVSPVRHNADLGLTLTDHCDDIGLKNVRLGNIGVFARTQAEAQRVLEVTGAAAKSRQKP